MDTLHIAVVAQPPSKCHRAGANPAALNPFSKTASSLHAPFPAVGETGMASKGLERPDYKPLMRKPRGPVYAAQPDRNTAGNPFPP